MEAQRGARRTGRNIAVAGLLAGAAIGVATRRPEEAPHGRHVSVITDDGVRLAADLDECASPELAVVFVHGWVLNRHSWHFQRHALSGTATLVFYDQRGHGASPSGGDGPCTVERLGDDLAAVIEQTIPAGVPVVLVGHSMGGMAIMSLAARRPELFGTRIVGAALLSTSSGHAGIPGEQTGGRGMRRAGVAMPVIRFTGLGGRAKREHIRFVNDVVAATPSEVMVGFSREPLIHDRCAPLKALRSIETMILVGSHDRLTPPIHSRRIAEALPDAVLTVVAGAGHMAGLERPDVVNRALCGLLRRVRDARAIVTAPAMAGIYAER